MKGLKCIQHSYITASLAWQQAALKKRQSFSKIQFVLLSSSCEKWSIAKRRLITVTGMNVIRHTILTDFTQRTDASASICFVKWICKIAAGLWGWIYTSWLSWFKRLPLPKEDIPLCVASSWPPPGGRSTPAPSANPALLISNSASPLLFASQGCAALEGWTS